MEWASAGPTNASSWNRRKCSWWVSILELNYDTPSAHRGVMDEGLRINRHVPELNDGLVLFFSRLRVFLSVKVYIYLICFNRWIILTCLARSIRQFRNGRSAPLLLVQPSLILPPDWTTRWLSIRNYFLCVVADDDVIHGGSILTRKTVQGADQSVNIEWFNL